MTFAHQIQWPQWVRIARNNDELVSPTDQKNKQQIDQINSGEILKKKTLLETFTHGFTG